MNRNPTPSLAALAAAALSAFALAACGTQTVDAGELEQKLTDEIGQQGGVKPETVKCPDGVELKKDQKLTCDLTAEGGEEIKIQVTFIDDEGNFTAEPAPNQ